MTTLDDDILKSLCFGSSHKGCVGIRYFDELLKSAS